LEFKLNNEEELNCGEGEKSMQKIFSLCSNYMIFFLSSKLTQSHRMKSKKNIKTWTLLLFFEDFPIRNFKNIY
jgi:hypothetical protein